MPVAPLGIPLLGPPHLTFLYARVVSGGHFQTADSPVLRQEDGVAPAGGFPPHQRGVGRPGGCLWARGETHPRFLTARCVSTFLFPLRLLLHMKLAFFGQRIRQPRWSPSLITVIIQLLQPSKKKLISFHFTFALGWRRCGCHSPGRNLRGNYKRQSCEHKEL